MGRRADVAQCINLMGVNCLNCHYHLVQADSAASWFFRSLAKALYWVTPKVICLETKCFFAAQATRHRSEVKIRIEDFFVAGPVTTKKLVASSCGTILKHHTIFSV